MSVWWVDATIGTASSPVIPRWRFRPKRNAAQWWTIVYSRKAALEIAEACKLAGISGNISNISSEAADLRKQGIVADLSYAEGVRPPRHRMTKNNLRRGRKSRGM